MGGPAAEADWRLGAAAYEVDDLQLVSAVNDGRGPCSTRDDLAIVLHGDAVRLKLQRAHELVESC